MKTRIVFYLLLVALFGFSENLFGMEETQERMDVVAEPSEIDTPQEYEEIIGPQATEDTYNTFFGSGAGYSNTTAGSNAFFGSRSGAQNSSGECNSFFGSASGQLNETGSNNSFFGEGAGYNNKTADWNTFIGASAGYTNVDGTSNTFVGHHSGFSNDSGYDNTFIGYFAGNDNTNGYQNTFIGYGAGSHSKTVEGITANCNVFLGFGAGTKNESGSRNVFLGYRAGNNEMDSDKLYIANSETTTPLIYGEFDNKFIRINGNFTATATSVSSDKRWKKEIEPIESPLKKISEIQGVKYRWKVDEFPDRGLSDGGQIGLIAQDVERVMPELVSEDKDGYKAVSYTKLTAVLVEAIKELKTRNERQVLENKTLRVENSILKKDIEKILGI